MSPILEEMPPLIQNRKRRDTLEVDATSGTDVYKLPRGPVLDVHKVTGYHNGVQVEFIESQDYVLIDDSYNDEYYIEIDFSTGRGPDANTTFTIDQTYKTLIRRYTEAHDQEFSYLDERQDDIQKSHELFNASDRSSADIEGNVDELEQIGKIFGPLGRRRGRNDQQYRQYLQSIVQAFNGRGSLQGLEIAIGSAVGTGSENVRIIEDFENLKYSVQIYEVSSSFISSAVNDLAELADPSVVELDQAIIVLDTNGIAVGGTSASTTSTSTGLGGGTLTMDGASQLG